MEVPDVLSALYPSFQGLFILLPIFCILYFVLPRYRPLFILLLTLYTSFFVLPFLYTHALQPVWRTVLRPVWRAVNWALFPLKFAVRMIARGARLVVSLVQQLGIWLAWFGFYVYFGKLGWEYIQDAWDWVYDAGRRVGYFLEELGKEGKAEAKAEAEAEDEEEEAGGEEAGDAPRTARQGRRPSTKKRKGKGK
ncbi:hypothetical protein HDZ31DRAFT_59973 [Schizophyllum fasciatum]